MPIKRQDKGSIKDGIKVGGQFKENDTANSINFANYNDASLSGSSPYPTKRKKVSVKLHRAKRDLAHNTCLPVAILKDLKTGRWTAQTMFGRHDGLGELFNGGGLKGDVPEVTGHIARTVARLANRGDLEIGNQGHMAALHYGFHVAGTMLVLPGAYTSWGHSVISGFQKVGFFKEYMEKTEQPTREKRQLRRQGDDLRRMFDLLISNTPRMFKVNENALAGSEKYNYHEPGPDWYSKDQLLIYASTMQDAAQHLLPSMSRESQETAMRRHDLMSNAYEEPLGERFDYYASLTRKMPDNLLADAAFYALIGADPFPMSGHDGEALKRYIECSETAHTSHIFEPSGTAVATFDADDLPSFFAQDATQKAKTVAERDGLKHHEFLALARQTRDTMKVENVWIGTETSVEEDYKSDTKLGDVVLGRAMPPKRQLWVGKEPKNGKMLLHLSAPDYSSDELGDRDEFADSADTVWRYPLSNDKTDTEKKKMNVHMNRRQGYLRQCFFPIYHRVYHPEINRIPLALYVMATVDKSEPAHKKAAEFILKNNYQPFVGQLLAKALGGKQSPLHEKLRPQNHAWHPDLLRNACKAWQAVEHDNSWYVKPGGPIDPEVMTKKAALL